MRALHVCCAVPDIPPLAFRKLCDASVQMLRSLLPLRSAALLSGRVDCACPFVQRDVLVPQLLRLSPSEILRRLPVIAIEDVGLPAFMPGLVWLMAAEAKVGALLSLLYLQHL